MKQKVTQTHLLGEENTRNQGKEEQNYMLNITPQEMGRTEETGMSYTGSQMVTAHSPFGSTQQG